MNKITSQNNRKPSGKRTAMRDIAVRTSRVEAFTVQPIDAKKISISQDPDQMETDDEFQMEDDFGNESTFDEKFQDSEVESMPPVPAQEPQSIVRVKFSKFAQLVSNHDFDEVVKNNPNEEVVLSSDLLTELAGAHDEREGKKFPIIFLVGLAIGVVLTYILTNK